MAAAVGHSTMDYLLLGGVGWAGDGLTLMSECSAEQEPRRDHQTLALAEGCPGLGTTTSLPGRLGGSARLPLVGLLSQ